MQKPVLIFIIVCALSCGRGFRTHETDSKELKHELLSGFSFVYLDHSLMSYFIETDSNDLLSLLEMYKVGPIRCDTVKFLNSSKFALHCDTLPKSMHKISYRLDQAPKSIYNGHEFKCQERKSGLVVNYHKNIKVLIGGKPNAYPFQFDTLANNHIGHKGYSALSFCYKSKKYQVAPGKVNRYLIIQ